MSAQEEPQGLRDRGEGFNLVLATNADRLIEALGRTVGASAVVRFRVTLDPAEGRIREPSPKDLEGHRPAEQEALHAVAAE